MNNADSSKNKKSHLIDETYGDDNKEDTILWALKPIHYSTEHRKVKDLNSAYANKELRVRPNFQRHYVWNKKKASRLIESVLLNVPLPMVYTAEEEDGTEVVIDGQQRLLSLFGFIAGKFPSEDEPPFKLSNLETSTESGISLNGKKFSDLEKKYQDKIKNHTVPIIKIESDSDPNVRFEVFERLNSGAVNLNAQELRNCVYRGTFNDFLFEMVKNQRFRDIVGSPRALARMADAEIVLRFLMFEDRGYRDYQGRLKELLNDFMRENQELSDKKRWEFTRKFKQATDLSLSVFGKNAFRRFFIGGEDHPNGQWDNRFIRALFDVVMWGFTKYDKRKIMEKSDAIREALIKLQIEDDRFKEAITYNTAGKFAVPYRFEAWEKQLNELLGEENAQKKERLFSYDLKRQLFEKSSKCTLCKQTIQTMDDAEVDHIKPYSKGGDTDPSNAQLAHRYCNRAKGNRE